MQAGIRGILAIVVGFFCSSSFAHDDVEFGTPLLDPSEALEIARTYIESREIRNLAEYELEHISFVHYSDGGE